MKVVVDNTGGVDAARAWLHAHRKETGLSFERLGKLTGLSASTLSTFSAEKYQGDDDAVAVKLFAYRDRLSVQAEIGRDAPMVPAWYETATSRQLTELLHWAQSGKIVLIVTTPGIGKTKVAQRLAAQDPNVWVATMSPSTAGVTTMAIEVGEAIGLGEIKGSPQQLSRKIRTHMAGKAGLLIVDEAQELTDKALNEIRNWHDRTGVGVALLGNDKVVGQIDSRKSALAQVSSRFSIRHAQAQPLPGDMEALLDAWGIEDDAQRSFLSRLGALPGALREVTQTLEVALMSAFGTGQALTLEHLRTAARKRNVKIGML